MPAEVVVVVQARMGSTRLPGKVLLPVAGRPMLQRMLERLCAARRVDRIVVATTAQPEDDVLVDLCRAAGWDFVRGSRDDLLDRHLLAAEAFRADVVVKVPSDCPLVCPRVVDRVLERFLSADLDYASNLHPATYPDGNDVEAMHVDALRRAAREATRRLEREHTTPYLWEHPELFRLQNVAWESGLDCSLTHRWTVDYPEDYELVRAIYDELWTERGPFDLDAILALLERRPELAETNRAFCGVNWYRHHLHELTTVGAEATRPSPLEERASALRREP